MPPGSCSLYTYPRCALDGDLEHRPLKGNRLALLNEMLLQLFANDEFAAETDASGALAIHAIMISMERPDESFEEEDASWALAKRIFDQARTASHHHGKPMAQLALHTHATQADPPPFARPALLSASSPPVRAARTVPPARAGALGPRLYGRDVRAHHDRALDAGSRMAAAL